MNCQEVQARLSDYLETSLKGAAPEGIETHLSACAPCRMEMEALAEYIRQMASLPTLDPPLGFTQRVMARVREIDERPGLWERWLSPFRLQIPIQATALVLVGILAVYLLEKEPPQKPSLMTGEATVSQNSLAPGAQNQEKAISRAELQRPPAKSSPALSAPAPKKDQPKATAGANERAPSSRAKSLAEERSDNASPTLAPMEPRGRASGIISGIPVVSSGIGSGPFSEPLELGGSSLRSGAMPVEPFADYEMIFRLQSPTRDQTRRENLALSQKSSGRGLAGVLDRVMQAVSDSARPQTIWFTVSKNQYEQLKRELRAAGTIESEIQIPLFSAEPGEQNDGQLQIKLTVFPAPESNRATPSSSSDR